MCALDWESIFKGSNMNNVNSGRADLVLKAEAMAGADVPKVIAKMCALAGELGVIVEASLNGVRTTCSPRDNPDLVSHRWRMALDGGIDFCTEQYPTYAHVADCEARAIEKARVARMAQQGGVAGAVGAEVDRPDRCSRSAAT
jgi:hypothetical protein